MKLKKTNETVNKQYDENGGVVEILQSTQYQLIDETGVVGSASVYSGGYSLNFNKPGDTSAMKTALIGLLNIEEVV